jgi:hypothetical protein
MGSGGIAPPFLPSALEWSASRPGTAGERAPVPIGEEAGWVFAENRTPALQPVARRYIVAHRLSVEFNAYYVQSVQKRTYVYDLILSHNHRHLQG